MPFDLHLKTNLQLYPVDKYPLTHFIDEHIDFHRPPIRKDSLISLGKYILGILSLFSVLLYFYDDHIRSYNSFYGPFHLNRSELVEEVKNFDKRSWIWRKEYFQIELGENNVIEPSNLNEAIRQYEIIQKKTRLIAQFKRIIHPGIFIKLPTENLKYFYQRYPFDFNSFSNLTLQCIITRLSTQTFLKRSNSIRFIETFYNRRPEDFNRLVLSHCGIFIGFLYKPISEEIFLFDQEIQFTSDQLAFNSAESYGEQKELSTYLETLLYVVMLFFFSFMVFSQIIVHYLLNQCGIHWFTFELSTDIRHQLSILKVNLSLKEKILFLDRSIQQTKLRWQNRLFIIQMNKENIYVVILQAGLHDLWTLVTNEKSPFLIFHVNEIQKIVHQGLFYKDGALIRWPFLSDVNGENAAQWLHNNFMELSAVYRQRYENRLRTESQSNFTICQNPDVVFEDPYLFQCIREEENFQRLRSERESFWETVVPSSRPASPEIIAIFRCKNSTQTKICDEQMAKEEILCLICFGNIRLNQNFARWPCPSPVQHLFHFSCMRNHLRERNTCPVCRHPIESTTDLTF